MHLSTARAGESEVLVNRKVFLDRHRTCGVRSPRPCSSPLFLQAAECARAFAGSTAPSAAARIVRAWTATV